MNPRMGGARVANGSGESACMACGHARGPSGEPWKQAAHLGETPLKGAGGEPYSNAANVLLRCFYCPGCAALLVLRAPAMR